MKQIYTIGHSTRPIDEFIDLLAQNHIKQLVDIRTIPKSRHNPQYGQNELMTSLNNAEINYIYMQDLGGLRPKQINSINLGWHNLSFRNYADYMQTAEFAQGITELEEIATKTSTAIMCAEAVPWRCHRSLVADALTVRDWKILDIINQTPPRLHQLTNFAVIQGENITYPRSDQ